MKKNTVKKVVKMAAMPHMLELKLDGGKTRIVNFQSFWHYKKPVQELIRQQYPKLFVKKESKKSETIDLDGNFNPIVKKEAAQ